MVRERGQRERPTRESERPAWSYAHASPHVQRAVYNTPYATPRRPRTTTPVTSSPLQRKGAYASPSIGTRASQPTNAGTDEDLEHPPMKWQERLEQWPNVLLAHIQGWWMDLQAFVHKPELGVPVGLFLHALSLLAQLLLPGSSFGSRRRSAGALRHSSHLFASYKRAASEPKGVRAYTEHLSRLIVSQRHAAQRWTSRMLSVILCAVALYNAYVLFSQHRTYRLWYRQAQDLVHNPHARLEAPPQPAPPPRTWRAWASDVGLCVARQIPIVEWFVPAPMARASPPAHERIYALRVWDVYEAPLWLFTVYSPAHALWWSVAGSLGMHPAATWLVTAALLTLLSLQAYWLAHEYEALVKDRQLLQAEMLHEYDEKVRVQR
ncbi:hypothetical protein MNAN1_001612 [Malassezia nana]|uniref:Nuclear rim protein 1 n=1 Tax=Malassezia nana TaxID=180528 RepID=A0AAF0EJ49_9BASI|nr:hypothetical protein MNAN1_001612 [Malassezia nana]